MRNFVCLLGAGLSLAVFAPLSAHAQQDPANTPDSSNLSDAQIRSLMTDMALRDPRNAALLYGYAPPEEEEEEAEKTYRYDGKKGLFHGVDLPHRTFNNIQYPY